MPVIRTAYTSPNWHGELVLVDQYPETLVMVEDRFSGNSQQVSLVSNQAATFNIPAASKTSYFKLPVGTMAERFSIAFTAVDFAVDVVLLKTALANPAHNIDMGVVVIDREVYRRAKRLPESLATLFINASESCLTSMSSAMYFLLIRNNLSTGKYASSMLEIDSGIISVEEQFYHVEQVCFQTDYEKKTAFKAAITPLLDGANWEDME